MCVACHQRAPKKELLRLVRTPLGHIVLDRQGKHFGRSAYLCQAPSCLQQARRRSLLSKHLASGVEEGIWADLEAALAVKQNG